MFAKFYWIFFLFFDIIFAINCVKQDYYYWRDYTFTDIPCDAFEAAPARYIGICDYYGNKPVAIYPNSQSAIGAGFFNNLLIPTNHVKIMCTANAEKFYWELVDFNKTNNKQIENAIVGGHRSDLNLKLFLGKIYHEDQWKIGEVVPNDHHLRGIWVWKKDTTTFREYKFYLLKYNFTDVPCSCSVDVN